MVLIAGKCSQLMGTVDGDRKSEFVMDSAVCVVKGFARRVSLPNSDYAHSDAMLTVAGASARGSYCPSIVGRGLSLLHVRGTLGSSSSSSSILIGGGGGSGGKSKDKYDGCWSASSLLSALQILFPNAIVSSTALADGWRVPSNEKGLTGLKRAIYLAHVKVLASRQSKEEAVHFAAGLKGLQSTSGGVRGVRSVHGIVTISSGTASRPLNAVTSKGAAAASSTAAASSSSFSSRVVIEACAGSIIVRPLVDDSIVGGLASACNYLPMISDQADGLIVHGVFGKEDRDSLESLFCLCQKKRLEARPVARKEDLGTAHLFRVQRANSLVPLPNGWWFNGNMYVDIKGTQRALRPDIDVLVEEYLLERNKQVKVYNDSLESLQPFL